MNKKIIAALVGVGVIAIASAALASETFMTQIARFAGIEVANKLESNGSLNPDSDQAILGATVHSQTVKQDQTQSATTLIATTTLQNTDSSDRVIDKVVYFASTTANAAATIARIALSSDGIAATTGLSVSTTVSSNAVTYVATSTFGTASQRVWTSGSYVICYTDAAVSTTAGFCSVEYYKP